MGEWKSGNINFGYNFFFFIMIKFEDFYVNRV